MDSLKLFIAIGERNIGADLVTLGAYWIGCISMKQLGMIHNKPLKCFTSVTSLFIAKSQLQPKRRMQKIL